MKSINPNQLAQVRDVIDIVTNDSIEWSAPNGGVVLEFGDGRILVCMTSGPDEDIAFFKRDNR